MTLHPLLLRPLSAAAERGRASLIPLPVLRIVRGAADLATASPVGFSTVGDLYAAGRRLDAAIHATLLADGDDGPAQDERAAVIARLCEARSRDVRGCRLKLELPAEALLASLEAALDALGRSG